MSLDLPELIAAGTTALIGGAFALRKLQSQWVRDGGDMAGNEAKRDVIELMRDELQRLSKVNSELAIQVNKFQLENVQLTSRLATVTIQMADLQHENAELSADIVELRKAIADFKAIYANCQSCPKKP